MFANSSTSSKSGSDSTTTEHTSTSGGNTSTTTGHSETQSHTTSEQHSKGGAESNSEGKSWASGEVEDRTQQYRDKYNTDYTEGEKVADTYQRLQDTLSGKPTFQSQYEDRLNQLYESIMNRDKFSYDFNADSMYQLYKDQYTQSGKRAMQDTMGQAAALTGGYGSSYGQSVGQQTYQNYLQELNDMIPTLRNQAYQEYQQEGQDLLNKYNITSDAYNREYGQYRDDVSDWQSDRGFNYGMYSDERNFDYNQFANDRNYWNQEYWNERNSAQSNTQHALESNWNDTYGKSDTYSSTDYAETTNTSSWSNTDSISSTSSTAWSNSNTASGGSGSGSGSSTGTKKGTTATDTGAGLNGRNDLAPFNISNKDYLANISQDQRDDMAAELVAAAKRSNGSYQQLMGDMIKEFGLGDGEIGYLQSKVQNAGYDVNYMPTPSTADIYFGHKKNDGNLVYENEAPQVSTGDTPQNGETWQEYLKRMAMLGLSSTGRFR